MPLNIFLHHHGYKQPRRQRFVLLGGQPCKRLPLRHGYGVPSRNSKGSNENVPFQGKNAGWRRLQRSKHVPNVSKSCLARIRRDRVEPHPLFQLSSRFGSLQKTLRCISKSHHRELVHAWLCLVTSKWSAYKTICTHAKGMLARFKSCAIFQERA